MGVGGGGEEGRRQKVETGATGGRVAQLLVAVLRVYFFLESLRILANEQLPLTSSKVNELALHNRVSQDTSSITQILSTSSLSLVVTFVARMYVRTTTMKQA